jgi:hypothetical protein
MGATLVGAGFSLTTAAAAGLGAPKVVWIVAAVLGVLSLIAAAVLYAREALAKPLSERASKAGHPRRGSFSRSRRLEVFIALAAILVMGWALAGGVDHGGSLRVGDGVDHGVSLRVGEAVLVCIDSSASTDPVRESYLLDLKKIVLQAALRRADFYAANCGANATGNVNWPVRRRFEPNFSDEAVEQLELTRQAEDVFYGGLEKLVAARAQAQGVPLGEVLAVMARQCGQAGGNCIIYLFTDGEWSDDALRVRDGVSDSEQRSYLKAYLPQLQDLAGSQVNFVGVGYGTSMGEMHLAEARRLASKLVEGAGAEMGAWTTRF